MHEVNGPAADTPSVASTEPSCSSSKEYRELLDCISKYEADVVASLDRWMLAIPGAGIAFVISLSISLQSDSPRLQRWLLASALWLLAISVFTSLAAKLIAYFGARDMYHATEAAYRADPSNWRLSADRHFESLPTTNRRIHLLSVAALIAFGVALAVLILFGTARALALEIK